MTASSSANNTTATTNTATVLKKPVTAKKAATVKKTATAKKSPPAKKPVSRPVVKKAAVEPVKSKAVPAPDASKDKKVKVIRDSFTIPKNEFAQLGEMKKRAISLGVEAKKSELIRAGLMALSTLSDAAFKNALANVPTLKTGRPGKN